MEEQTQTNDPRTLLLLPFPQDQALLIGQNMTIVLKEGRFLDLLDQATENHCSMMGTILLGNDDLLPIMPLCEISDFSIDAGFRGKITSTVTLKCVGRAKLSEAWPPAAASLTQHKPYMIGRVSELKDGEPYYDLATAESLVSDVKKLSATKEVHEEFQQNYWLALNSLGYTPTSLLTRDPMATSQQKEIEAASWAAFSALKDKNNIYSALRTTDAMERLQLALRMLLTETALGSNTTAQSNFESGFE